MNRKVIHCRLKDRLLFKTAAHDHLGVTGGGCVISISPHESGVTLVDGKHFPSSGYEESFGIIGVIRLKYNRYILLIDEAEESGEIEGHTVWKVKKTRVIPVKKTVRTDAEESQYVSLVEMHLNKATLYFSYGYDLTNSIQRNAGNNYNWRNCDSRFFWNKYVSDSIQQLAMVHEAIDYFVLPLIYGYFKMERTILEGVEINIGLVTRRSRLRAGTRYFRRGIDEDGNVANFNETEQILHDIKGKTIYSFVQTRGSVPVYWSEVNNLKYRPILMVGENGSVDAFKKHFEEQKSLYGDNYLVNLVNQNGYEKPIKHSYESTINSVNDPQISYVYFDFHHECSKMRWHRVKLLLDQLTNIGWNKGDYFQKIYHSDGTTEVIKEQQSVIRTNCMDCLDRTNVVQSVLADYVLQDQLEKSGILSNKSWSSDANLLFKIRNIWADNADAVSIAYSGTGALKTDFTRTGQRTRMGAFQDFYNSISRYYQNNFTDGPRQDSFDLFLGNFKPFEIAVHNLFVDRRPIMIQLAPTVLYAALTVIFATIFFPKDYFASTRNLRFFFGSSLIALLVLRFVTYNGMQYVNWPKFCDLGFLIAVHTHNKEQVFKGLTYAPSKNYVNPDLLKRD